MDEMNEINEIIKINEVNEMNERNEWNEMHEMNEEWNNKDKPLFGVSRWGHFFISVNASLYQQVTN